MPDIRLLSPSELLPLADPLADVLHACVEDGASVGFVLPFTRSSARAFWLERVFPSVQSGNCALFGAFSHGQMVGTVQLGMDLPPNQPHRADVAKLLVHPSFRRQGLGRLLMEALEGRARDLGKTLLVLDTRSSDPSRLLYLSLGFAEAGEIPGYCRNPHSDVLEPTMYMYKDLTEPR